MHPEQTMKRTRFLLVAAGALCTAFPAPAATRYVDLNNPTPAAPYTSWATAATNIQDAVDEAVDGEEIVVTNGVYATGGRVVLEYITNRVAIYKPLTVRSVNGPLQTAIEGRLAETGTTNGVGAIRCAYVGTNAVLSGFTLTNGHTLTSGGLSGGGALCELSGVVSNCILIGNTASYDGGGAYSGTLKNCTLNQNWADRLGGGVHSGTLFNCTVSSNWAGSRGGGAYGGTLINCTLSRNSAYRYGGGASDSTLSSCVLSSNWTTYASAGGGGVQGGTLNNCLLTGNRTSTAGGGAYSATLSNCTLSYNSASGGGGASDSVLNNCTLTNNSASSYGGGAYSGTLINCTLRGNSSGEGGGGVYYGKLLNCILTGNSASSYGGGAFSATLTNCTLSGNSSYNGGGAASGTLYNCIAYYNSATVGPNYHSTANLYYSCTTPLPSRPGNISNEPLFVNANGWADLRLQSNSPCINSGGSAYTPGPTDLDGKPRVSGGTVDMGAYEFQNPSSVISYAWLQNYGLPTDGSADYAHTDTDGMNNWQEWVAGTNPNDAASVLSILSATPSATNVVVSWSSVSTRVYSLLRATNLATAPAFSVVQSNIAGRVGTTNFTDTNALARRTAFYRVAVQPP